MFEQSVHLRVEQNYFVITPSLFFFLKYLCNIFFLKKTTISALEDFKLTCSPDIWATGSWFLPRELNPASTAHMEQALSHRTVCFDSPKWSIQVTLAVQELSNVSMSTLCREHAEVNLHPRSEPRFFQKSDIEHNLLDFCRPWLRSWQHSLCECPVQDRCETRAVHRLWAWLMTSPRNCPNSFYRCAHQQAKSCEITNGDCHHLFLIVRI